MNEDQLQKAREDELCLKSDYSIDSVKRSHTLYAGLSGVSVAGIFTCLGASNSSFYLTVAICCYAISLPAFVAAYLFHDVQLARNLRKFKEFKEIVNEKIVLKLTFMSMFILTVGIFFTTIHLSGFAGLLFAISLVLCSFIFYFYYMKLLSL